MKKLIPILLLLVGSATAQLPTQAGMPYQLIRVITCTSAGCNPSLADSGAKGFFVSGLGYYKLSWTVSGTVSACTVSLDSNTNRGASWSVGGIASTGTIGSCATQGAYVMSANPVYSNLARITPSVTGSGEVTFTLTSSFYPFSG